MSKFLIDYPKTHSCGELSAHHISQTVTLYGWVHNRRDHGGRIFIDLRDREGLTQVVFGPDLVKQAYETAQKLRSEFCIGVTGCVSLRTKGGGKANPNLKTGDIEIEATNLELFSSSQPLPFPIKDHDEIREDLRLKYRYLDLRRPNLQKNFILRHRLNQCVRQFFDTQGFLEIETPFMGKYTPGGARNFLVPSRLNAGQFYALAESPQIYKQLFMVAGLEKYFQIVRCFRDEDLRNDRQMEFTQIDIEMSFVDEKSIFNLIENFIVYLWKQVLNYDLKVPFTYLTYQQALELYGEDKPDLRNPLKLYDLTTCIASIPDVQVPIFLETLQNQGIIKILHLPAIYAAQLSNAEIRNLEQITRKSGSLGLASAKIDIDSSSQKFIWTQSPFSKFLSSELQHLLLQGLPVSKGDLIFFQVGKPKIVNQALAALRNYLGQRLKLNELASNSAQPWNFVWITNFPLFELNEQGQLVSAHHPFTSPQDKTLLPDRPQQCLAKAYDLVLNGQEIGGGSIRIHEQEVQEKVFQVLGLTPEEIQSKFGFLLEAFSYGPPPHGGIAFGLDRLTMLMCQANSLRDVIAFPKTHQGTDLMTQCPTTVTNQQLKDLHIQAILPLLKPTSE